ncbi:MAG: hypothetical protein VYA84_17030 [Planctomycetota bacterium]|nr:hypothetical protein [Planctomycetota bacterium]
MQTTKFQLNVVVIGSPLYRRVREQSEPVDSFVGDNLPVKYFPSQFTTSMVRVGPAFLGYGSFSRVDA